MIFTSVDSIVVDALTLARVVISSQPVIHRKSTNAMAATNADSASLEKKLPSSTM